MQTLNLKPYIFSAAKNISFSVNTWILLAFACVIITHFAFRFKKKVQVKRSIPRLDISDISFAYLALKPVLSGKMACGVAALQLLEAFTHFFQKEGICCIRRTFKPCVLLYKSQTVKSLLNSKNLKRGFEYELMIRLQKSIFSSDLEKWKKHRKLITPTFSSETLDDFCHTFNEQAILFIQEIMRLVERNQFVQIDTLFSYLTLNIMCETAMGIQETNSRKNVSEYMQALLKGQEIFVDRVYMPWLWPDAIFWQSKLGKQVKKIEMILDKFVNEVILEKKIARLEQVSNDIQDEKPEFKTAKSKKRAIFLNYLLDIHFQDNNHFSINDVAAEVEAFIGAGSLTSAVNMSWVLYLLGLYPDIQEKVHKELDEVFDDDVSSPITKHHVKKLKYLDCVIKETMRLYPPVPYISRILDEETVIDGYIVPKGTTCGIFIYGLHRDPEFFSNPEVFDPERFSSDEKRPTHAYIPFAIGPRNCLGQQFAKLEITIIIASVLRRFKVKSMLPLDKLLVSMGISVVVKNGLHIAFEPRKPFSSKSLQA